MADLQHCADCPPPTGPSSAAVLPHPVAAAAAALPHACNRSTQQPQQQDVLNPATFSPPRLSQGEEGEELPRVVIEFCDRCRWLHRAVWTQTELFLTFPPAPDSTAPPGLRSIALVPRNAPETGGRFRVWLLRQRTLEQEFEDTVGKGKERWNGWELVWDRKVEGGFPEMKDLKQRIRNIIAPSQQLGHSDKPVKAQSAPSDNAPGPAASAGKEDTTPNTGMNLSGEMMNVGEAPATIAGDAQEEPRKPGQLLASDFAPSFRCG